MMRQDGLYSALLQSVAAWKKQQYTKPLLVFVPNNLLKELAAQWLTYETPEGLEVNTIPQYMRERMRLRTPQPLTLLWRLYGIHKRKTSTSRDFVHFMSWGLQLLADFDEIDRNLLNPQLVFFNLNEYHQLELLRGTLPEAVVSVLQRFWKEFEDKKNLEGRSRFLQYWQHLPQLYEELKSQTLREREAWDGLLMRLALEDEQKLLEGLKERIVAFAGFSLVSRAEESFMTLVNRETRCGFFYDINPHHLEAHGALAEHGEFLRQLMKKFPPTVEPEIPRLLPQRFALKGFMGKEAMVQAFVQETKLSRKPVLVVTPSEETVRRLKAVLGSRSDCYIPETDISQEADIKGFCDLLSELHESYIQEQGYITLSTLLQVSSHPFLQTLCEGFENFHEKLISKLKDKETENFYSLIKPEFLKTLFPELSPLLQGIESGSIQDYLLGVFDALKAKPDHQKLMEEVRGFLQSLSILKEERADRRGLMKLINTWLKLQPIGSAEVPTQLHILVSGVLGSRALDCDEVYFLDFNDGLFPHTDSKASVIPYTLRMAFGLPVMEHFLAEQLYLFFRLAQRTRNLRLFYDAQPGNTHSGQPSLVLRLMEATLPQEALLETEPMPMPTPIIPDTETIAVEKTPYILNKLTQLLQEGQGLSATALNTYLACPLRFYFRYIAEMREPENLSTWNPTNFGKLFHNIMEALYKPLCRADGPWLEAHEIDTFKAHLPELVRSQIALAETGASDNQHALIGKNILLERMLLKAAEALLETDKQRVPFRILSVEKPLQGTLGTEWGAVRFYGKADRVDEIPDSLIVVDYKTGATPWKRFNPDFLEDIFDEKKRSGYDVQVALYAWLLAHEEGDKSIRAEVFEVRSLLAGEVRSESLADQEPLNKHFQLLEKQLRRVVSAMLSDSTPFYQTTSEKTCSHCPYNNICRR